MQINIYKKNQEYVWSVYDGPNDCELYDGVEKTLGECFEQIIQSRLLIEQKIFEQIKEHL